MEIETKIKNELLRILAEKNIDIQPEQISLDHGKVKEHGDYASSIALRLAKVLKKNPMDIAEDIAKEFSLDEVERYEVVRPGFINFFLKTDTLTNLIKEVFDKGERFGSNEYGKGKKINVEYVSANPTGELHLGHARGAAVGDSLTRILSFCGFDVTREYYINDAGNQVNNLAKSVEARYLLRCGKEAEVPENGYHGQDIINVADKIYNEIGDKYASDPDSHLDYFKKEGIKLNFDKIKNDLKNFHVEFDVYTSEQWVRDQGLVEKALQDIKPRTYESENAVFLKTVDNGDDKDRVLVKSDGSYTYLLPDIAYHRYKYDRGFDHIIDILGADHHGYVARLKSSMKSLGKDPDKIEVVMVQMVRLFKDGEEYKMSKRTGNAVSMEDLCQEVGTDAVRYFFVTRSASTHLDFDLNLATTMGTTNPVYYVQYAHARLMSILESGRDYTLNYSGTLLKEESERNLLKTMAEFKEVVLDAGITREPYKVTTYIRKLATRINDFYTVCRVLDPANAELTSQRLALVKAAEITLKNALTLIGVTAPNYMKTKTEEK